MPRIELILPGESKTQVEPFANTYRITVERDDGIACSDMEAKTAMTMLCIEMVTKGLNKGRKRNSRSKKTIEAG
jgi:hypothetical protein